MSAIRGKLSEKEKKKRERDSFGILYTGYLLYIVKIKREIDKKERGKREREREKKREREISNIIIKVGHKVNRLISINLLANLKFIMYFIQPSKRFLISNLERTLDETDVVKS